MPSTTSTTMEPNYPMCFRVSGRVAKPKQTHPILLAAPDAATAIFVAMEDILMLFLLFLLYTLDSLVAFCTSRTQTLSLPISRVC